MLCGRWGNESPFFCTITPSVPEWLIGCTGFVCVIVGFKIMKPVKLKGASPYFWNTRLQTQLKQQNGMDVGHCI